MNSLQSLPLWQDYFDHPKQSTLGLFGAAMSLGSIIGFPVVPYICDHLGRRWAVIIGSLILCLGTGLQAGKCTAAAADWWLTLYQVPSTSPCSLAVVSSSAWGWS
jgi:MFS family permease